MEGRKGIQRSRVFAMVMLDIALLAIFMAAFLPSHLQIMAATYLPVTLVFDVVFLRRNRKIANTTAASSGDGVRSGKSSLYICSALFFIGTLYGVLTIIQGELPRTLLPLLLVPLSVTVYCWRMARRIAAQESNPDNTGLNHSASR